jgi:hypothetical protein
MTLDSIASISPPVKTTIHWDIEAERRAGFPPDVARDGKRSPAYIGNLMGLILAFMSSTPSRRG